MMSSRGMGAINPKKMPPSPREMAKGGMTVSKRADGCAVKGKTRGTMITMKSGGKTC